MTTTTVPDLRTIPATALGAPGAPDPARCSLVAIEALARSAGQGLRLTSIALDVASHPLSPGEVAIRTIVDKRSRSIVFASIDARLGNQLVFSAQGLFSGPGVAGRAKP